MTLVSLTERQQTRQEQVLCLLKRLNCWLSQDSGYVYLKNSRPSVFPAAVGLINANICLNVKLLRKKKERYFIGSNCFLIIISHKKISQEGYTVPSNTISSRKKIESAPSWLTASTPSCNFEKASHLFQWNSSRHFSGLLLWDAQVIYPSIYVVVLWCNGLLPGLWIQPFEFKSRWNLSPNSSLSH